MRTNVKKFNKIYEDYRMEDVNDEDKYWLVERTDAREDIDIKNEFSSRYNKEVFNKAFDNQELDTQHMQLIK